MTNGGEFWQRSAEGWSGVTSIRNVLNSTIAENVADMGLGENTGKHATGPLVGCVALSAGLFGFLIGGALSFMVAEVAFDAGGAGWLIGGTIIGGAACVWMGRKLQAQQKLGSWFNEAWSLRLSDG